MNKESTNVELKDMKDMIVSAGSVVTDPENKITKMPTEVAGQKITTSKESGMIEIALAGKGYKKEIEAEERETGMEI